ncbi:MAG: porin [Leptolyngbya foveolarum]|uniref:Porin n=1 Tax=Leptolyngbya foveolarum TaxID=47253 RepID=A0A2W4TRY3_9CYAN|nr:MAG: porin [Leptolyngbya foveolarum]
MIKVPQIKKLSLAVASAVVLTAAVAGVAAAAPCLIPTSDCPPANCG